MKPALREIPKPQRAGAAVATCDACRLPKLARPENMNTEGVPCFLCGFAAPERERDRAVLFALAEIPS